MASKRELRINTSAEVEPSVASESEKHNSLPRKHAAIDVSRTPPAKDQCTAAEEEVNRSISPSSHELSAGGDGILLANSSIASQRKTAGAVARLLSVTPAAASDVVRTHAGEGCTAGKLNQSISSTSQEPSSEAQSTPAKSTPSRPAKTTPAKTALKAPVIEGLPKTGVLAAHVRVECQSNKGVLQMAADRGRLSKKGLQLSYDNDDDDTMLATTRGFARDVQIRRDLIRRVHDKFLTEGKLTIVVEDDVGGDAPIDTAILISNAKPDMLRRFLQKLGYN